MEKISPTIEVAVGNTDPKLGALLEKDLGHMTEVGSLKISTTINDLMESIQTGSYNAVLIDIFTLGVDESLSFIERVRNSHPAVPFCILGTKFQLESLPEVPEHWKVRLSHYYTLATDQSRRAFKGDLRGAIQQLRSYWLLANEETRRKDEVFDFDISNEVNSAAVKAIPDEDFSEEALPQKEESTDDVADEGKSEAKDKYTEDFSSEEVPESEAGEFLAGIAWSDEALQLLRIAFKSSRNVAVRDEEATPYKLEPVALFAALIVMHFEGIYAQDSAVINIVNDLLASNEELTKKSWETVKANIGVDEILASDLTQPFKNGETDLLILPGETTRCLRRAFELAMLDYRDVEQSGPYEVTVGHLLKAVLLVDKEVGGLEGVDDFKKDFPGSKDFEKSILELNTRPPKDALSDSNAIWLCQYRRSEMGALENRLVPGIEEQWSIGRLKPSELREQMNDGDTVILWRTIDKVAPEGNKKSRGGIVGWGKILNTHNDLTTGRIAISVTHAFPEKPIPRDDVLEALGYRNTNWPGQVSLKRLDDDEAEILRQFQPVGEQEPKSGGQEFHETELASDRAETTRDRLGRAPLAFTLAHHINRIWTEQTKSLDKGNKKQAPDEAAFILHIDSPWGGGKTTFANFVSRILNPQGYDLDPKFTDTDEHSLFADLRLDEEEYWPSEYANRKWITVTLNAWQHQHVSPPWWNFYELIRKQCLYALPFGERCGNRISEWMWRVWSPEIRRTLAVMALIALFVWFLSTFESIESLLFGEGGDEAKSPSVSSAFLLLVLGLTGGSGVALLASFRAGVRKIVDSAGNSTDEGALGETDPIQRFSQRFTNAIEQYARPVLVIVDDLDRCEPKYVVELVRGMLTIFRSARVVFMLLGDKSWIETSFAVVQEEMTNAHTDSNISFGGRFAEKAIQLSFILPEPDKTSRDAYIDYLLLGNYSGEAKPNSPNLSNEVRETSGEQIQAAESPQLKKTLFSDMQAFELEAKEEFRKAKSGAERKTVIDTIRSTARDRFDVSEEVQRVAEHIINREAALRAASSERTEEEIRHGISKFKSEMPDNPRRIKRIINMIAIYQASAQSVLGIDPGTERWRQLVLWIIVMSEHPISWRILSARPDFADKVIEGQNGKKVAQPSTSTKENPDVNMLAMLNREPTARLIKGESLAGETVHLDTKAVLWLRLLTPLA